MIEVLPYDPGSLPTRPAPSPGEVIEINLDGFPPYKDIHCSIRNRNHPRHADFIALRKAAIAAMAGRAWYFGAIKLDLVLRAPKLPPKLSMIDFVGGVMDTLDGSSGVTFTFLPIVYEDDCQVAAGGVELVESTIVSYTVRIEFLATK